MNGFSSKMKPERITGTTGAAGRTGGAIRCRQIGFIPIVADERRPTRIPDGARWQERKPPANLDAGGAAMLWRDQPISVSGGKCARERDAAGAFISELRRIPGKKGRRRGGIAKVFAAAIDEQIIDETSSQREAPG